MCFDISKWNLRPVGVIARELVGVTRLVLADLKFRRPLHDLGGADVERFVAGTSRDTHAFSSYD